MHCSYCCKYSTGLYKVQGCMQQQKLTLAVEKYTVRSVALLARTVDSKGWQ